MAAQHTQHRGGFSLLEMAIVVAIVALILGSGISLGTNAVKAAERTTTMERMATLQRALEDYVAANGYLPCPYDLTRPRSGGGSFGVELRDGSGTGCALTLAAHVYTGGVPVRTLGLPDSYAADAWGNKFTYAVSADHVGSALAYLRNDASSITVMMGDRTGTTYPITQTTARTSDNTDPILSDGRAATYVLVSHGPDGRGAYPLDGTSISIACGSGNQNDVANCNGDGEFYDTEYNDGENEALYFDDYVVWGSNALARPENRDIDTINNGFTAGSVAAGTALQDGCPAGTCEAWCAPCAPVSDPIATWPAPSLEIATLDDGTNGAKLCRKIITSTNPCTATCLWSGQLAGDATVIRCP